MTTSRKGRVQGLEQHTNVGAEDCEGSNEQLQSSSQEGKRMFLNVCDLGSERLLVWEYRPSRDYVYSKYNPDRDKDGSCGK